MPNINFLTDKENEVMLHLNAAMRLFRELGDEDPQDPTDTYNFGHYVDAARNAVILRGARRIDPKHLMPNKEDVVAQIHPALTGDGN